MILAGAASIQAQQSSASPSPTPRTQEEPVRVFTEEVRLPIVAVDQFGHYDPAVVPEDILVLEDGEAQQIRSVRHIPANVLLVLDTGGELSGLGGFSKKTSLTREVAKAFVNHLPRNVLIETMQFNNKVELLQPWTNEHAAVLNVLQTKLSSGKRVRFSDAIQAAADQLKDRPEGTRHVVFITDGVDTPGSRIDRAQAIKRLAAVRATVHIISYTTFVQQKDEKNKKPFESRQLPVSHDPISSNDPTMPPGQTRSPTYGVTFRFDPAMKRQRKAYEADARKSEQVLTALADETGGKIYLPKGPDEMIEQAKEAAGEIGSEYVVTYRPKRPLAEARPGEYRRIDVASRRVGLNLRSRRGYVVP
jgi:VWFA-related protein